MFFKGDIFQGSYNKYGVFSHYQIYLCYYVPQKIDLDSFRRIEILFPPHTIKYDTFIFNPDLPKYHYIQICFKEVSIGQAPEHIVFYDDLKYICRHYVLRHYVTGTMHGTMGKKYNCMAISVGSRSVDFYFIVH